MNCKLINTLFVIADYFISYKKYIVEDQSRRSYDIKGEKRYSMKIDQALIKFSKTPGGEQIIDSVQAIAIFLLLSIIPIILLENPGDKNDKSICNEKKLIGSIINLLKNTEQSQNILGYIVNSYKKNEAINPSKLILTQI